MFNWSNSTASLFVDDWTDNHTSKFENLYKQNGQVCVFLRCNETEEDPYGVERRKAKIISALGKQEHIEGYTYIIIETPNIPEFYNA